MLKALNHFWRRFCKKTHSLFVRNISEEQNSDPKESPLGALKEFLTRYPRYIVGIIVIGILPFILSLVFFFILTTSSPSLKVPELEGLSLLDAAAVLQDRKLAVSIIPEVSHKYPQNYIIRQDIKAGRVVKEGRTLLLYVSAGDPQMSFPSFVGKNFFDVKIQVEHTPLSMKSFQIQSVSWEDSPKPFGEILRQTPLSGSYQDFPINVSFVVSNGSPHSLPSLVGQPAVAAAYALETLGLIPRLNFVPSSDPKMDGRVLRQTPLENTVIFPKMNVQLTVAQYNKQIAYFHYEVPSDLDGKVIGLLANDTQGQKILFLGPVNQGESIEAAAPLRGAWKAAIYVYDNNNNKTFYKDLTA